jgi:hypothetical protein
MAKSKSTSVVDFQFYISAPLKTQDSWSPTDGKGIKNRDKYVRTRRFEVANFVQKVLFNFHKLGRSGIKLDI